jgi:hypothetical protein
MGEATRDQDRAPQDEIPRARVAASFVLGVVAFCILAYLALVVAGRIPPQNRLGMGEVGLALIGCLFLTLVLHPEAFNRLSLLKLPGGIEVTLEKIQQKQEQQQRELDSSFAILSNLLSLPEKYHLRALARGGEEYTGCGSLRDEILRLKRFGLIDEVEGQKVGDMFDGKKFRLDSFVHLTPNGTKFIRALDAIESQ